MAQGFKNISLLQVIKSLMVQMEVIGEHNYFRLWEIARNGLKELTFDTQGYTKTVLLTVNETTNTVSLPSDYVKYTKVGVYADDGRINYLALDNNIYIGSQTPTGAVAEENIENDPPVYKDRRGIGKQYGRGGGQNIGYFRENRPSGTLEFATGFEFTEVILEYVTDGLNNLNANDNVHIHSFLTEALRSYIWWHHIKYKRDYTAVDKDMAKKDYYNQKRLARARVQGLNKDQILVQSRKHIRQSPKT